MNAVTGVRWAEVLHSSHVDVEPLFPIEQQANHLSSFTWVESLEQLLHISRCLNFVCVVHAFFDDFNSNKHDV